VGCLSFSWLSYVRGQRLRRVSQQLHGEDRRTRVAVQVAELHRGFEVGSGRRLSEVEALAEIAAQRCDLAELCGILYLFGDRRHTYNTRQVDDGRYDGSTRRLRFRAPWGACEDSPTIPLPSSAVFACFSVDKPIAVRLVTPRVSGGR